MPETSAFKQLYTAMFNNGGDFSKLPAAQRSQHIKCYVKESFPHFLVTDNFYYVACYFTKKALDDFKAKNANVNVTDLKSRVITITDWTLEMNRVNSADVFTSYGGHEVRLIVKAFTHKAGNDKVVLSRHAQNLFRDAEMKTVVQNFHHGHVVAAAAGAKAALPDISAFKNSGNVSQGVVASTANCSHKEGKSAFVSMESIFKQEKGSNALAKLNQSQSSGKVRATGGAKKSKSAGKKVSKKAGAVHALMKSGSNAKRSAVLGARAPNAQSPGDFGADGSANIKSMSDFKKMVSLIKKNKDSKRPQSGKRSRA